MAERKGTATPPIPPRTRWRQQPRTDVENASYGNDGSSVHYVDDEFSDQAISDIDRSTYDEASSVPTRESQQGRKVERDDEKHHNLPLVASTTPECRPRILRAFTADQAEEYDLKKRVDGQQTGPTGHGLHLDARGVATRDQPRPSSESAISSPSGISGTVPPRKRRNLRETVEDFIETNNYKSIAGILFSAIHGGSTYKVNVVLDRLKQHRLDVCRESFRDRYEGGTVLHVALLINQEEISRLLITKCPELISVRYPSGKFQDQTAFHIAAPKGQCEILALMLAHCKDGEEINNLLNAKATGTHFTEVNPAGAFALTAAAWGGHCETLGMLIEKGADLEGRLHNGNTALHYIVTLSASYPNSDIPKKLFDVVWNKCIKWWEWRNQSGGPQHCPVTNRRDEMVLRLEAFRYLLAIKNDANQNIISLAVNLASNLTKHILKHVHKLPQIKAPSSSTYDVTEITSFGLPGGHRCRYNPDSVLHILGNTTNLTIRHEDLDKDLVEEEPIKTLLRMKWGTYRIIYIIWLFIHLILMVGLSVVSLHLHMPKENKTAEFASDENATGNATYGEATELPTGTGKRRVHSWYLVFSLIPLIYLILEIVDISVTSYGFWTSLGRGFIRALRHFINAIQLSHGNAPYRFQLVLFSVFVEIWVCMHMTRSDDQDIPLSVAMILGWLFMVFFTRACRHTCRFSVMMQKMMFDDCITFVAIFVFFWLAFYTAMHVLLEDRARLDVKVWNSRDEILNMIIDVREKAILGITVVLVCAAVSVILLSNMLLAMMNTSYEVVKGSKINIWRFQQLSIMLMLERRLWWWEWLCERSQDGVSVSRRAENDTRPKRFYLSTAEIPDWNEPQRGFDRNPASKTLLSDTELGSEVNSCKIKKPRK